MSTSSPVFVLCTARSGSTLLRLVLNSNPAVSCPSETNAALIATAYFNSLHLRYGDENDPEEANLEHIRKVTMSLLGPEGDKLTLCDKSLPNAETAGVLIKVWPEGRFICLYRHVMDFIASALEASPWGFSAYGFAPYVARAPDNFVAALAHFWLDHTRVIRQFELQHPDQTCGIRYEDLVTDANVVAKGMWEFLDLEPPPGDYRHAPFSMDGRRGASDHKVWFSADVDDASVGRGTRISSSLIPPAMRDELNRMLADLQYQQVTLNWGSYGPPETAEGIVEQHQSEDEASVSPPPAQAWHQLDLPRKTDQLVMSLAEAGAFANIAVQTPTVLRIVEDGYLLFMARLSSPLSSEEAPREKELDTQITNEPILILTRDAIIGIIAKMTDVATALRRGNIRYYPSCRVSACLDLDGCDEILRSLSESLSRFRLNLAARSL